MTTNIMVKVVFDTNMFLSGFIFHGMIKEVFDLALVDKLKFYVSQELIEEVAKKLQEFGINEQTSKGIFLFIKKKGIITKPKVKITASRDPKDNFLLELSETAQVDYLITRDKDLLDLPSQEWKDTKIIKPEDFLPLLRKTGILLRNSN